MVLRLGISWENGKENGSYYLGREMVLGVGIGILEKKMEITTWGERWFLGYVVGYWRRTWKLLLGEKDGSWDRYWDIGEENGNYYLGRKMVLGLGIGILEKKMEAATWGD